ncbi:LacI family DNA-binding transcriptional regulator [Microbacterium sp. C23T]
MPRLGLKDIAQALGVSESTVSLALNDRPTVNAITKQRVLDYVAEVGYSPNPMARGLATQKTMTIGLVCPDTENPYYGSLVRHVADSCEQLNYSLMLSLSGGSLEREARILKNFVDKQVDGVVIMPQNAASNPYAKLGAFADAGIPLVFCTSFYSGFEDVCVRGDYAQGAFELTSWLLQNGHRELWYLVTEDVSVPVASERIRGYQQAFEAQGVPLDPDWIVPCREISSASGATIVRDLLQHRDLPDGILALNDYMAFGVIRELEDLGYAVPQDVSVAGYDDVFYASLATVQLTTVRQDLEETSNRCVSLLMSMIDHPSSRDDAPATDRLVPQSLVVRGTTARP